MLFRKLRRELWEQKTQFFAIFMMSFLGLLIYVGMDAESSGAWASAQEYYDTCALADFWVQGACFSQDDAALVRSLPGVRDVQRCRTVDAKAEGIIGKGSEEAEMTLYFLEENNVSTPYVVRGEAFDVNKKGFWLDEQFAGRQKLSPGDELTVKTGDEKLTLKILGTVMSPEHVYYSSKQEEMVPDYGTFGYAFLPGDCYLMMSGNGMPETDSFYNMLKVDTFETYTNDGNVSAAMKDEIKKLLGMDDLLITDRKENASYSTFLAEMEQHRTMSVMFPAIFMIIAVLGITTTMTRMAANQRTQIGTMKALGFSDGRILVHYVSFGFAVCLAGSVCGAFVGAKWFPMIVMNSMKQIYLLPQWKIRFSIRHLMAVLVVTAIATFVCFLACRKELKGMPAQTLRPKAPKNIKPSTFERTAAWRAMGFVAQWNIRDIRKNKLRTLMGVFGVAGSMMLLICAFGCRDSMNYMPEQMFGKLNLNERTIVFEPGTDAFTVGEYARKYGGQQVQISSIELVGKEGTREQKVKSASLTVVDSGSMMRFQDYDQNEMRLTRDDVLISTKMAELLGVQPGEIVRFRIMGEDTVYRVRITGCNRTPTGQGLTMSAQRFRELECDFEPNQVLTNYRLPDDLADEDEVQAVQDAHVRRQEMFDSLSIMNTMIALMIGVAVMLGLVVLYNLSELSFVEKVREYTTLKVLGLQERVIRGMILTQNLIVGVIGVIAGIPLGKAFTHAMFSDMGETQDMVEVITVNSYLTASAGAIVIALAAGLMMSGRIRHMNMVDALKSNE